MAKRGGHEEEMIKLEHVVLASPEQMEFIIEGMRNPMNSWEKSDSDSEIKYESWHDMSGGKYEIGLTTTL